MARDGGLGRVAGHLLGGSRPEAGVSRHVIGPPAPEIHLRRLAGQVPRVLTMSDGYPCEVSLWVYHDRGTSFQQVRSVFQPSSVRVYHGRSWRWYSDFSRSGRTLIPPVPPVPPFLKEYIPTRMCASRSRNFVPPVARPPKATPDLPQRCTRPRASRATDVVRRPSAHRRGAPFAQVGDEVGRVPASWHTTSYPGTP